MIGSWTERIKVVSQNSWTEKVAAYTGVINAEELVDAVRALEVVAEHLDEKEALLYREKLGVDVV